MGKSLSSEIGLQSKLPTFFKNSANGQKKGYPIMSNIHKSKH
jgi:hypothetical protein